MKSASPNKLKDSAVSKPSRFHLGGVISFDVFDHLYTTPEAALKELNARRKNKTLRQAVRASLGENASEVLKKFSSPRAVLFRQVGTPTHETLRFLRLAKEMGLKPLIFEYYDDKFVSAHNRYKRSLGKMPIYQYTGSDGVDSVKYNTILDFPKVEGLPISKVNCLDGKSLVDFHHDLLNRVAHLKAGKETIDLTPWLSHIDKRKAASYYEHIFALFIRDGVLFENYFVTKKEGPFVQDVIAPAFYNCYEKFGYKPIIAQLLPDNEELRLFWDSYPKSVGKLLGVGGVESKGK